MAGPLPINSTFITSVAAGVGLGIGLVIVKMGVDFLSKKFNLNIPTYYAQKMSYVGYDDLSTIRVDDS